MRIDWSYKFARMGVYWRLLFWRRWWRYMGKFWGLICSWWRSWRSWGRRGFWVMNLSEFWGYFLLLLGYAFFYTLNLELFYILFIFNLFLNLFFIILFIENMFKIPIIFVMKLMRKCRIIKRIASLINRIWNSPCCIVRKDWIFLNISYYFLFGVTIKYDALGFFSFYLLFGLTYFWL